MVSDLPVNGTMTILPVAGDNEFRVLMSNFLCPLCGVTYDYNVTITLSELGMVLHGVLMS